MPQDTTCRGHLRQVDSPLPENSYRFWLPTAHWFIEPNPERDEMCTKQPDHRQIFNTAAEITDPAERAKYLDEVCGGDAQFRAEIEDLLRHDMEAGDFLERPIVGERPTEILNALTDRESLPDPPPDEVSLDFLKPCDVPGRLGRLQRMSRMGG